MKKVLVPMANGMEEMEAIIIVDVLRRGGVQVVSASLHDDVATPIHASRNTIHLADTTLSKLLPEYWKEFDMIFLPGGNEGANALERSASIKKILNYFQEKNQWIGAICAAPRVLLNHGILQEGDLYTAYPGATPENSGYTGQSVQKNDSLKIITGKGPGAAFAFALEILEILEGDKVRNQVQSGLQLA
ncbi:MAG: DJ-1/PfpI family protein [Leptospira sp.]|nr:DJ-1/PfpI family protein [Leptospira sp.]